MTNTHKFMLRTGKYYPDEDIYKNQKFYYMTCYKDNHSYYEESTGYWEEHEFNSAGQITYYKDSKGFWYKREYDKNGNCTFREDSYDS